MSVLATLSFHFKHKVSGPPRRKGAEYDTTDKSEESFHEMPNAGVKRRRSRPP